ncbi:MAG TPA: serine/threonine-protein kinase [Kofleriaceae bacterium]|nr:serine/threonine-protein kinase [Kofleriaceae bacterium]
MEDRFGPYTVYECLGAGGMATVHRASIELEDDELREVALKRLLPQLASDKRFIDDFIREGKLAAELQHPNIVRILELGRIGRTYFIAMDLVRGRSLMALMRKAYQKRLPAPIGVVVFLMRELCDALEHAHDAQIVHRDLTPSNLIVTEEGHLKIIDFGVAKALVGNLQTSSGLSKGKLGYMSMEAIGGKKLDTRADIFSAGVVMWELISTRRLFKGSNEIEIINKIRDAEVQPPSVYNRDCPADLDDIVLKALERSKEERWSAAGDMRDVLGELCALYGEDASAEAVVAWMADLRGHTVPSRLESDGESTLVRMEPEEPEIELIDDDLALGSQRGDAFSGSFGAGASDRPYGDVPDEGQLAVGSDVATYDDTVDTVDDPDGATAAEGRGSRKFKEVDTIVSTFPPRKS